MFEYKNVKRALAKFIETYLSIPGGQVFRAPPIITEITKYPAFIIRSANSTQVEIGGLTGNEYTILVGIMTRGETSQIASDELDDLLQTLDTQIATQRQAGLDSTLATGGSRWHMFTRLGQPTDFDNAVQDDVGMVVYGVTATVKIQELMPLTTG